MAASPATKPERMPGTLERLDRLENMTSVRNRAAEQFGRLQAAERRLGFVEVDFRVALVGGDDEAVVVGKLEQLLPVVERQHLAGRIARRADVDELDARPFLVAQAGEVEGEVVFRQRVEEARLGAGEVGRAFVDLVERIGADDQRHVPPAPGR